MGVTLITGAAAGIGAAITRRLARDGQVLATDRDEAALAAIAAETGCVIQRLDVTSEADWDAAAKRAEALGGLAALVNNAGFGMPMPIAETSLEDWRRVLSVNLDGAFLGVRAAFRAMAGRGGAVVNIASLAAIMGTPGNAAYCAAKAGVHLLTKTAAREGAMMAPPVRVNAVLPGLIATESAARIVSESFGVGAEEAFAHASAMIPLKRPGAPGDIAEAAAFLLSPAAAYVTGAALPVDGGWAA